MNMKKRYYYIDTDPSTQHVIAWGCSDSATHTGEVEALNVHRVYLPQGQYSKLVQKLDSSDA